MHTLLVFYCGLALAAEPTLHERMEHIARTANGRVGATVMLLETGESTSLQGDQQFPMQSVYKFPIGMAVLRDIDRGKLTLEQKVRVKKSDLVPIGLYSPIRDKHPEGGVEFSVRELLRYMVVESDGTASDVLLRLAGGPGPVTRYLQSLGVKVVIIATSEAEMSRDEMVQYRNWSTPDEMVKLLRVFYEGKGLSASSRALLMQFMIETTRAPGRLKGLLPAGAVVAHRTGTSGTRNGLTRATNDVGLITLADGRHLAVAVFVSDSRADAATREAVIAKIARAAWDSLSAPNR